MEATDQQMQNFCDQRIRVRAEAFRNLVAGLRDDAAAIGDEYARAVGATRWNDARTDGPPHLLQSGNGANPDDVLNFNAFAVALLAILDGTNTANDAANAATIRANWAVLDRACVRAVSG